MTTLSQLPDAQRLYLKAATTLARRSKGKPQIPPMEVAVEDVAIDPAHLQRYAEVCGFEPSNTLPITFPHVVAGSLHLHLMTQKPFPFPLLGLVHIRNEIRQFRPLTVDDRFNFNVRVSEARSVRQGLEFDLLTEATVGDDVVWSETSTMLHRIAGPKGPRPPASAASPQPLADYRGFTVPSDTGKRYAAVSSDYNPIHLTPISAKLFGFKRHIAHGMWSAARCAAELGGALERPAEMLSVQFKQPLFLPGRVALKYVRSGDEVQFSLLSSTSGKTHLSGSMR